MKKIFLVLLMFALISSNAFAQQWSVGEPAGTRSVSDIDYYVGNNQTALDRLLANYNSIVIAYNSASQLTASAGEVVVSNSDGSVRLFLQNTTTTTITWADIDADSEAATTTYYVYAIAAAASSEAATFKISTSATAPTGVTYYKKIGSFYNDASSNIDRTKIYVNAYAPTPTDSSGISSIMGVYDYGTSSSSSTFRTGVKIAYGSVSVGGASTASISNLPFSSASTYSCSASHNDSGDLKKAACAMSSGSALTILNEHPDTRTIHWLAIGY